jgi:hypothetical protein
LAAVYSHHRNFDVVADTERFTGASGQYEHGSHRKEVEQWPDCTQTAWEMNVDNPA